MASVAIVYRKDKLNQKKEAPIHFRIIKDRKISYITSGYMLHEKYWDAEHNKVKTRYKNSGRLNSYLASKLSELQDNVLEQEKTSKSLSSKRLKEKIYGKQPEDIFEFSKPIIEQYFKQGRISTYDRNRAILQKLRDYVGTGPLYFNDITPAYLAKYETYLRNELGNITNTVHLNMKFIRKLFNDAFRQDVIEWHLNPFIKYRIRPEKTTRQYLTEDELKSFEEYKPTHGTRMELHQDMFIFASYTGGLRVSDVLQLKWKNFDGSHVNFSVKKTSEQLSIKLPDRALEIVKKYSKRKNNPEHFIFPMFENDLDVNDAVVLDRAISIATAYINKNLKFIAEKVKISKPVSFHISRHTWATRALRKGISIDKVSKLMGHAAIKETQIYAKIVSQELDKAMDAFNS